MDTLEITQDEAEKRRECGKITVPVRFFVVGTIDGEFDTIEVTEAEFLESSGTIAYERHTVFANGCNQICLTKG